MFNWYSDQESIVKPEKFAPKNLDFVKFGVIVFIRRVYNWMKAAAPDIILEKEESVVGAKRFFATESGLAVFHSYFGAPATVALAEALIAAEIKQLIVFGEAGSISPKIDIGEILIPTFAIREEGVSYHYLPPNVRAEPSSSLLRKIEAFLDEEGIRYKMGGVWTTDAPFRETMDKVLAHSEAGALAVEMECSAIFCLSKYREADSAAILVITDTLHEGVWKPAFQEAKVINVEKKVSETLMKHLAKLAR